MTTRDDLHVRTVHSAKNFLTASAHVVRSHVVSRTFQMSEFDFAYLAMVESLYLSFQDGSDSDPSYLVRYFRHLDPVKILASLVDPGKRLSFDQRDVWERRVERLRECARAGDRRRFVDIIGHLPASFLYTALPCSLDAGPRKREKGFERAAELLRVSATPALTELLKASAVDQSPLRPDDHVLRGLVSAAGEAIASNILEYLNSFLADVNSKHDAYARAADVDRLLRWHGVTPDSLAELCQFSGLEVVDKRLRFQVATPRSKPADVFCTFVPSFEDGGFAGDWKVEISPSVGIG